MISLSFLCLLSTSLYAENNDAGAKVKWGYKGNIGPERWWQLDPSFLICANGTLQSPINIMSNKLKNIPNTLVFHYETAPMILVDNGNTKFMLGNTETTINDGHSIQLNFTKSAPQTITFDGQKYNLLQLHFHSPSENQWNGRSFPLEIHFVHQGKDGKLLVIGVFVKGGKANQVIDKMIKHLPKEEGKEFIIKGESINPRQLIPAKSHYYYFIGSLTTPPCSEGVQWILMADPITATPAQIAILRQASGGGNARHVQKLHNREISYTNDVH